VLLRHRPQYRPPAMPGQSHLQLRGRASRDDFLDHAVPAGRPLSLLPCAKQRASPAGDPDTPAQDGGRRTNRRRCRDAQRARGSGRDRLGKSAVLGDVTASGRPSVRRTHNHEAPARLYATASTTSRRLGYAALAPASSAKRESQHAALETRPRFVGGRYTVIRIATSYLVTDVRCPGVSAVGIAFSVSSPCL
jgi:hypothetical protein